MIFHTLAPCRARATVHILVFSWTAALLLTAERPARAADFSCPSGDVTCLIASINTANATPGPHVITLAPGSYILQTSITPTERTGLPPVSGVIRIRASAAEPPTVIECDRNAPPIRIFRVTPTGVLTLDRLMLHRASGFPGIAILNDGTITIRDAVIADNIGEGGTIRNFGTLNVIRSVLTGNASAHVGGGISNAPGGIAVVEDSTISHNGSADAGGIYNEGSLTVRNSAILSNTTDCCQPGGGVLNIEGSVEIVNSTIAGNRAGGVGRGGGGIANLAGDVSVINSTVRDNDVFFQAGRGGGVLNEGGTLRLQNSIVAGNTITGAVPIGGPDCSGAITSLGNNLIGDLGGCDVDLRPTDLTGDPGLGPLVGAGENDVPGGAHYPVLAGSPVIDQGNPDACPATDQLGKARSGTCDIGAVEFGVAAAPLRVRIDIGPDQPNRINLTRDNVVSVAILGRRNFNPRSVDVSTVRFGATGSEAAPVGRPGRRDVNGDGRNDLVLRFRIDDTGILCGAASAAITGQVLNGDPFTGASRIRTTGCD